MSTKPTPLELAAIRYADTRAAHWTTDVMGQPSPRGVVSRAEMVRAERELCAAVREWRERR